MSKSYTLHLDCPPDSLELARVAQYLQAFAGIMGKKTTLHHIESKSYALVATVEKDQIEATENRLRLLPKEVQESQIEIETMMGEDHIKSATLYDEEKKARFSFVPRLVTKPRTYRVKQDGWIDGKVVGMVGKDDTLHLHLLNDDKEMIRVTLRDEEMAKKLLAHFREGFVRVHVNGYWERTQMGWRPESDCIADEFIVLDDTPAISEWSALKKAGGDWANISNAEEYWKKEIRGA